LLRTQEPTSASDGASSSNDGGSLVTSISKDGVTWTFSAPVLAGQFVTGDYWIVGPATVTAISPAPTNATPFLNGSVVNLPTSNGKSPFDSRLNDGTGRVMVVRRQLSLVSTGVAQPGDSLVFERQPGHAGLANPRLMRASDKSCSPVRSASVLTGSCRPLQPRTRLGRPTATGARPCIARVRYAANLSARAAPRPNRRAHPPWRSSRPSSGARGHRHHAFLFDSARRVHAQLRPARRFCRQLRQPALAPRFPGGRPRSRSPTTSCNTGSISTAA